MTKGGLHNMGQKTHPIGFRLGIIKDWHSKWYAHKSNEYRELLQEDLKIRQTILSNLKEAGISKVISGSTTIEEILRATVEDI